MSDVNSHSLSTVLNPEIANVDVPRFLCSRHASIYFNDKCALIILFHFLTLCLHKQFDPNHDWEIITSTYQVELFVFNFCFSDLP